MFSLLRSRQAASLGLALLLLLAGGAGCATARVRQFQSFSQAGVAYTNAVDKFLGEAGAAAIDADSTILLNSRDALDQRERGRKLVEQNKALRERLDLLNNLQRHGGLLREYFETLGRLAGSKRERSLGSATQGLFKELGTLRPQIAAARIGQSTIGGLAASAVQMTIVGIRSRALEQELRERAETVEQDLHLQEAALTLLASQMKTDLRAIQQTAEAQEVVLPFAGTGSIPKDWQKRRRELLEAGAATDSADAAARAAKKLRSSFVALVEGRYKAVDLQSMLVDINQVVDLMEKVEGKGK